MNTLADFCNTLFLPANAHFRVKKRHLLFNLENSEKDIDLNARSNGGVTALMHACYNGHRDIVQLLLDNSERNIDLNARDDVGWTPFLLACKYGHRNVVQLLVEHSKTKGIDIDEIMLFIFNFSMDFEEQ